MVVLAAAVVTKTGKALVSRQFVDMSRIRIEGLLAAFPKLVGTGKQHTYVETENVRYLYQPIETMYLVLVTNKSSNILEDLETLRLCGKIVPEYVEALEEEDVAAAAFDLLFAFDEVISLGHKENVTVAQVRQNTEMESHEEKLHKMIIQIQHEADACLRVQLASGATQGYQFKTHPNIDKAGYSNDNVLGLKDPSRPFPSGAPLGVLKWRLQTRDESVVPLSINCWPSISGGESYVNIEYESTVPFDLQNVHIYIPLPSSAQTPQVNQIDGDWRYDMRKSCLVWSIELIDNTNRTGSAEFVVPAAQADAFFPIEVEFSASRTICDVKVESVVDARTGQPVKYGSKTALVTEGYHVE
ncbi:hypothetical protein CHLNCDRAFT_141341 [Chlorella variabilis]|uniref:Coatomer subunit delta n=1 Tax=Chlorella variabilis TaxID=554065 RepID=E1ZSN8_CHLVA|nr:hypothetical protein CHLNCDRAFT_141341 [Chlorella variabilis]EFN51137.1 hypothetical protein CHLNCDRAFT_141341 [Chlorella variabilis]|eukprot:XP_005843239.1 hypothetical protein CHLNCDRAFT_141341 [Chlorella variabilis]